MVLKTPTTLEALDAEWERDSRIDESEPGKELLRISSLNQKYLRVLSHHNLLVKKLEIDYKKQRYIYSEYYNGNLNNPEDLKEYGFDEPFLVSPGKRSQIPAMLDSNDDLNKILMRRILNQEIVDKCTYILKELHSRTFQIRSFIDWYKFTNSEYGK